MKVAVGTLNPAKINAVKGVFLEGNWNVVASDVSSGVAAQPFSDEETKNGACTRAKPVRIACNASLGIGLEGGVVDTVDGMFLCNWGALCDQTNRMFVASGAKIILPAEIAEKVRGGRELGDVMSEYTKQNNIREKEGAIGIFTNHLVTRSEMFGHIVKLLYGQYLYSQKNV